MKRKLLSIACLVRSAYEADKRYWRDLIVRAIEDGVVWFLMFAACWTICHLAGGILKGLGVG